MKRHASVFALMIQGSFWKALGLLLLLTAVEILMFCLALDPELALSVQFTKLSYVFGSIFLWLTLLLCAMGGGAGYTLERLRISPNAIFLWQALSNCLFYLLLWAWQTVLAVGLGLWYVRQVPEAGSQALLLAFYQSRFLHGLLPLGNLIGYIANGFVLAALSLTTAALPVFRRRGKFPTELLLLLPLVLFLFPRGLSSGTSDAFLVMAALLLSFSAVIRAFCREEERQ